MANISIPSVIALRSLGLSMWDIAYKLYLADHPEIDTKTVSNPGVPKTVFENEYLYAKGAVADIVMEYEKVDEDYDHEGGIALIGAVIMSAVNDYGNAKTASILRHDSEEHETKNFCEAMRFFTSKKYDSYMNCLSKEGVFPSGESLMSMLDKQALEGRWMNFHLMQFKTKAEAQKMIDDHPKYTKNAYPYYQKKDYRHSHDCWKIMVPSIADHRKVVEDDDTY